MADPWASPTDVAEITGATVDADSVGRAQVVIETFVGRTSEATHISARDVRWLRRAVAYQAAWMADQPDLFGRTEVDSSSQDGASATYRPDSHLLAPLARRALKKLSWRGNRSVQVGYQSRVAIDPAGHWVNTVTDVGHERWVEE